MKKLLLFLSIAFIPTCADAQQVIGYISGAGVGKPVAVSSINPLPVNATVTATATFVPFTPTSATSNASLSVTSSSQATALPTGVTQVIENTGSNTSYVTFSIGAGTATTAGYPITAGTKVAFNVGSNTYVNYITASGTSALTVSGGSGGAVLAGGGSSGGSGASAVANAAAPTYGEGSTVNLSTDLAGNLRTRLLSAYAQSSTTSGELGHLSLCAILTAAPTYTTAQSSPVRCDLHGSIAVLNVDSTGAALDPNAALPAGPNLIGKVGIDQTTAGTTNGVVVNSSALPTGAATAANQTTANTSLSSIATNTAAGATAAKQCTIDAGGACVVPQAGTSQRTLTATNLSTNTNTTVCPTATNPVATEIYFTTAGVGVGLNGQTLTTAVPGATSTNSPDIAENTAGTLYVAPVGISNAITAYGAAGVVRCVQTLRQ